VESVDAHDCAFAAVLEVSHAVEQVGDDDITGNHGIGENSVSVVLARNFEGVHGLFLQMLQTHLLGFGNELFLVELFRSQDNAVSDSGGSACRGESRGEVGAVKGAGGEKSKLHGVRLFSVK